MPDFLSKLLTTVARTKDDPFIRQLRRVCPRIMSMYPQWSDIDDVLDFDLFRRSQEKTVHMEKQVPDYASGKMKTTIVGQRVREYHHVPKDALEPWSEYALRVRLTPFFPETPGIVGNLGGALFAKEPAVETAADVQPYLAEIGTRRQAYMDLLRMMAQKIYSYNFMAVFVDFRAIPLDVQARLTNGEAISVQEAQARNLNEPVLGVYTEKQILDFEFSKDDGRLEWIKVRDVSTVREGWDDCGTEVETYRIIDRHNIVVYNVALLHGKWRIIEADVVSHGATDADGIPECPVLLHNPDLDDSRIYLSAVADLTATRILSNILWSLHFHGTPQQVLKTVDTSGKRMRSMAMGVTRFIELAIDPNGNWEESLEYLQLDTAGLELLVEQYDKFVAKANELAKRTPPKNMQQPVAESGLHKMLDFKTGEQNAITEQRLNAEQLSDDVLRQLTRRLVDAGIVSGSKEALESEVRTSFDPSFMLGDPEQNLDLADRIIELGKKMKLPAVTQAGLRRAVESIVNLSDKERQDISNEIKEREEEKEPPVPPPPVPVPPIVVAPENPAPGSSEEDE